VFFLTPHLVREYKLLALTIGYTHYSDLIADVLTKHLDEWKPPKKAAKR
jgi:hypothetical protein